MKKTAVTCAVLMAVSCAFAEDIAFSLSSISTPTSPLHSWSHFSIENAVIPVAGSWHDDPPRENYPSIPRQNQPKYREPQHPYMKWIAFGINFVVGGGVGSFIQGDTVGGIVGLTSGLTGVTFLIIGLTPDFNFDRKRSDTFNALYPNFWAVYAATAILIFDRVFELSRPFAYARGHEISFYPAIDKGGNTEFVAKVSFKI